MRLSLLLLSFSLAAFSQRLEFYVNGGGRFPENNFEIHERDALTFWKHLFKHKKAMLNAGGVGTPVAPGGIAKPKPRDELGFIRFRKSSIPFSHAPARSDTIRKMFASIRKSKPSDVTLVWGDHGKKGSISLWQGESLTTEELTRQHKSLPPNTWVRSIHLHCHAGSALVEPSRGEIPKGPLLPFLKQHYRARSCGLATGNHDELGQYYGWDKPSDQTPWKEHLAETPTLESIKKGLSQTADFFPTVLLTSDYFISDVFAALCKKNFKPRSRLTLAVHQHETRRPSNEQVSPCDVSALQASETSAGKNYQSFSEKRSAIKEANNKLQLKLMEKHYPKALEAFLKGREEIEELYAIYTSNVYLTQKQLFTLRNKIKAIQERKDYKEAYRLRFHLTQHGSIQTDGKDLFDVFLSSPEGKIWWKAQDGMRYTEYAQHAQSPSQRSLKQLNTLLYNERKELQLTRKRLNQRVLHRKRAAVERYLKTNPALKEVKQLYDSIRKCETSPLS